MGVTGLTYLMDVHYPQVKRRVSIKSLADAHRSWHPTDTPVLVIDGRNIIDPLCEDLDWTFGGQWLELCQRIEEFAAKWTAIGVKPVFIFDGTFAPEKERTWIRRRNDGLRKVHEIFTKLRAAYDDDERRRVLEEEKLPLRGRGTFFGLYLRNNCACDVYFGFEDTDKDLASFAKNDKRCFGIMSNDTDFLIYDTKAVLTARDLNLNDMSTALLDKQLLMQLLGIHEASHLAMYACMMGNDVITRDMLRDYHEKLGGQRWRDFKVRSDAICEQLPLFVGQPYELVSSYMFGEESYAKDLKEAVKSYALTYTSSLLNFHQSSLNTVQITRPSFIDVRLWNQIASSCMRASCSPDVFEVLKHKVFRSPETIEQYGVHGFSGSVFKQVRQRTYYLLFKHLFKSGLNGLPNVVICECIASPGQRMGNSVPVRPLQLNLMEVPTLDHVFFGSDDEMKLKLFLSCFNIQKEWVCSLRLIPPHLRFFSCIVKFLFAQRQLQLRTFEKEALIAQASKQLSPEFLARIQPVYDTEAISFGGFFAKAIMYSLYVYAACGRPFAYYGVPFTSFDGKCYNYFYAALKGGSQVKPFLSEEEELLFTIMMEICSRP